MTVSQDFLADFQRSFQSSGLSGTLITQFRNIISQHYADQGRDLPWRQTYDPYQILVSEIMLQQTQVERVLDYYGPFLQQFPTFQALAHAPLAAILAAWQGLGYNRRAQALQKIAQLVVSRYGGQLPADRASLQALPGIGAATAGAVLVFAFEQPVVFLETNIRRVYLHFFFPEAEVVTDKMLWPLILMTLDVRQVRPWYYALMDYGAMLKKTGFNPNRRSAHYQRQSPFPGSDRELRSRILRLCLTHTELPVEAIVARLADNRVPRLLQDLLREKFLLQENGRYRLATGQEGTAEQAAENSSSAG
ncbi:MAG: A/G-specific adenine glycosylase [Desulfobacca sp.]|uniref:A/G-specific adenine glycosylase n=1 Tax=Desulfobacca sp. TaxID=2067990 RepID=UPI00404ABD4A